MSGFQKERFAELLKTAIGRRSLNKYADQAGVSNAHVSRLMRCLIAKAPEPETIKKLAEAAHNDVTYDMLMEAAGHYTEEYAQLRMAAARSADSAGAPDSLRLLQNAGAESVHQFVRVPLLGYIAAGQPLFAQDHIVQYDVVPNPGYRDGELFSLIVQGDSMTGSRIYAGDKVLVKVQPEVEDGEIAVVNVDGDHATLKRVKRIDGKYLLLADNPKYEPILIESENARVCGKVIQVIFDPNVKYTP
ncbi:S24 family peptidase [Paenibacillus sp. HJGM_3]|uniref:S24 family peptidase n=1 Tax=Paenibacillus sp. HJGM_3 TaxID=3379816 RepID=UPI00385E92EC